jgi:hypothetical protein
VGIAVAVTVMGLIPGNQPTRIGPLGPAQIGGSNHDPQHAYPQSWKVSDVQQAASASSFKVYVPQIADANPGTLAAAFVYPSGNAVAFDFPASPSLDPSAPPVRQPYLEVWESPWTRGDPVSVFKHDVQVDPEAAKSLCTVHGVTGECIDARSANDDFHTNAAFVDFVLDGTEIQVSGGDNLSHLVNLANSLVPEN